MRRWTAFLVLTSILFAASIAIAFPLPGPLLMRPPMDMPVVEAVDIVLYRDMAWVREVRRQAVAEGTSDVALAALPRVESYTPAVRAIDELGTFDVISLDYQGDRLGSRGTFSNVIARVDAHGGDRTIEVSYLAPELSWMPSYVLTLPPGGTKADLTTSAFIVNHSGRTFADANLRIVSGMASRHSGRESNTEMAPLHQPSAPLDGEARPLLELQGIDIPPAAVRTDQSKLIEIMHATAVPVRVEHFITFSGSCGDPSSEQVTAGLMVAFRNDRASGLGEHLTGGYLTVKAERFDGTTDFIGRASLDETRPGELVQVHVGSARDVTAVRTIVDSEGDSRAKDHEYTYRVALTNRMPDPVVVTLRDVRSQKILESSHAFTPGRGAQATCDVTIPANGSTEVVYTARYRCR